MPDCNAANRKSVEINEQDRENLTYSFNVNPKFPQPNQQRPLTGPANYPTRRFHSCLAYNSKPTLFIQGSAEESKRSRKARGDKFGDACSRSQLKSTV